MHVRETLNSQLVSVVSAYDLPGHPFIRRFSEGAFSQDAIRWWAMKMLPGSNRFNQAFLRVTSRIDDYRARVLMLKNIYTEHGELNPDAAHVALFMRFMRGISCPRVDVEEDDGSLATPELRFKRFEIQDNEPVLWSLGRFAAIEAALPDIFTRYIQGLRKTFPGIADDTIEYFHAHCELDPTHTAELLEVAGAYVRAEADVETFCDGARDMLLSIADMFSWMDAHMERDAVGAPASARPGKVARRLRVADMRLYGDDASVYDPIYFREQVYRREAEFILGRLRDVSRPSVLDLCAGTGSHARLLTERGASVVCVDRSEAMLEQARRKVQGARFVEADVRDLSLPEKFDAVICMYGAIHYIEEPQDIVRVLRRAHEHLKSGGLLVIDLRDWEKLPESHRGEFHGGRGIRKFWAKRRGVDGSDLYVVSAFDMQSRGHFLEVHNLFHTDPFRVAAWARMVGFREVELTPDYQRNAELSDEPSTGTVALVAKR